MTADIVNVRVRSAVTYIKLEGCNKYSKIYFNTEYEKAMYTTALTAATSGKPVTVEFEESDGCDSKESELIFLDIAY
ncbi:hypothetical protein ACJJIF_05475 [Microbulbifer sp. SSSA002]|uniref:hypothetical protein n=1 Tax=Microbulbifer sp. SSSA002 TaxID=3243376 RepID=UPI0040391DEB